MIVAPTRIEPARIEEIAPDLADAALELANAAASLGRNLSPVTLEQVADLIRIVNSYYSNMIEGSDATPREIGHALTGQFDADATRRALQREHVAHVRLQVEIDTHAAKGQLEDPTSPEFIKWLHREMYRGADAETLFIRRGAIGIQMRPGALRDGDVEVGDHVPPPHEHVEAFISHFHARFRRDWLHSQTAQILAVATAHHRLAYIHPFLDGNGPVSRLMTHAMLHQSGIHGHGLWSVSRGLARGLAGSQFGKDDYGAMMRLADRPRQGDRDGRGNLSLQALETYTRWFLSVCLEQVRYMEGLVEIEGFASRLNKYADMRGFQAGSAELLRAVMMRGRVEPGEVPALIGMSPHVVDLVISQLTADGILGSVNPGGTLQLRFPSNGLTVLFPRLCA